MVPIGGRVRVITEAGLTPSQRIIKALQSAEPNIQTRRFRQNVLSAIFEDGVASEFVAMDIRKIRNPRPA